MNEQNKIKECPFPHCVGGVRVCIERKGGFFVFCHGCNARGPACDSELTAIQRWNAAANQLEALRKERDGLEESCERLKELIDTCNSMWNNTIQERNKMARDYDNERNRANKLESEIEPLRNKVEVLNKNLVETTDRAMVAEVQRDEAREWARRLYHGHPMWRMSGSSYVPQSPEWLDDKAG